MYHEREREGSDRVPRRGFIAVTAAAAFGTLAGCAGNIAGGTDDDSASVVETADVSMVDTQFEPRNIHVDTGTTVTWTNEGELEHTVTSASDNWSKDTAVPPGEETTHTFDESGVYDVYCTPHGEADLSGMSMKVGVGDASIETPLGDGDDDGGSGAYG